MSERILKIKIEAGDKTCASAPGVFCPWMWTQRFGQERICHIFSERRLKDYMPLEIGEDGWIQRHPDCIVAEVKVDKI